MLMLDKAVRMNKGMDARRFNLGTCAEQRGTRLSHVSARSASRLSTLSSSCLCFWAATLTLLLSSASGLPATCQARPVAPGTCKLPLTVVAAQLDAAPTVTRVAPWLTYFFTSMDVSNMCRLCRARSHTSSTECSVPSSTRRIGSEQVPSDIRCPSLPGLRVRCGVLAGYMPTLRRAFQKGPSLPPAVAVAASAGPPPRPEQTLFLPSVTEEGLHPNNHPHCFLDRVQAMGSHRETKQDDTLL